MIRIASLEIGAGMPKICVPLASANMEALLADAELLKDSGADLAEFRADYFSGDAVLAAKKLRETSGGFPVLFTLRGKSEGGEREIPDGEYRETNLAVIASGAAALVDVELSRGEALCSELVNAAKSAGIAAVISSHNFGSTPAQAEMLDTFEAMRELGGIPKLAVMPRDFADTLALLSAAHLFKTAHPDCPIIAISMGKTGVISRVAGEFYGCAITFASLKDSTAPGQLPTGKLRDILRALHESQA